MTELLATRPTKERSGCPKPPRRYDLKTEFFDKAIKAAIQDSLFSPVSLGERHDVRLKPNFKTACWAYLPPHQIFLGTDLFEKPTVKLGMTDTQQAKYIANHYHHELGHALFTERNMKKIHAQLALISAPFGLFNLFEDARMEHLYCLKAEYAFGWLDMEDLKLEGRPESLLFGLIQAEGNVAALEPALEVLAPLTASAELPAVAELTVDISVIRGEPEVQIRPLFARVLEYYERIIATKKTLALLTILKEWLDEFGRPPESKDKGGNGKGAPSDLELSHQLMTSEAFAEAFKDKTVVVQDSSESSAGAPTKATPKEDFSAVAQKGTVLGPRPDAVDMARATKLATKFAKLFQSTSRYVATVTPQKRMSARNFCLGRPFYKRKELKGKGSKSIFLEVDCSGSMGGFHMDEGKVLISALSLLARQGQITGHVVLSAVVSGRPCWELFKLPMSQDCIDRISGFAGAEGLEGTLRDNLDLAKRADYVFVYTDGQICDRPVNKATLHEQGVYTWGLYAGSDESFLEELMKYFDKAVMRQSAEALVDAILAQIK